MSAEAEVLAHHAGEFLLRLYLAHEIRSNDNWPACPPLDLSRLRSFSEFKKKVATRFGEDSDPDDRKNLDAVARVFHGTEILENLRPTPPSPDAFERSVSLIEGYLRAFAHQHLSQAAIYNAAKHGLALTPTEMGVPMGDGSLLKVEGPAIQLLEVRDDRNGRRRWEQVTHWVRPDRQMALIWRGPALPCLPRRRSVHGDRGPGKSRGRSARRWHSLVWSGSGWWSHRVA